MVIHRRTGWTGQIAPRTLLAVLFVVSLAAAGCSSDDELGAGDAATVGQGSVAQYAIEGGTWTTREAGEVIPAGAQVRTAGKELRLTFRQGSVRLSADATATLTPDRITLERGEALIDSDGGLSVTLDDTTMDGAAQYRVTSGLAARVGVYSGQVALARPAQQRTVRALRELDIADFRLATTARPLQYREADPWDQELLAEAIAFDGEAARLSRGLDLELGTRAQPPAFYRQFAPGRVVSVLSAAGSAASRRIGPPSDVLLAVFVARAADGPLPATVRRVTGLRSDGARWGLIATELDVAAQRVVAAIDGLDNRSLALADSDPADRSSSLGLGPDGAVENGPLGGGGVAGGVSGTSGSDGTGTSGTSTGTGDKDPGTGGEDPPSKPPGDGGGGEEPPPPPPPEDPVQKVVDDVVDEIADPPDGEDVEGGTPILDPVRDLLDGG